MMLYDKLIVIFENIFPFNHWQMLIYKTEIQLINYRTINWFINWLDFVMTFYARKTDLFGNWS